MSAILLIASLIALSGIDLLEDLGTPANGAVQRDPAAYLPQLGQSQTFANDIIESAGRVRRPAIYLLKASPADADRAIDSRSFNSRQLHKLNRVFLI